MVTLYLLAVSAYMFRGTQDGDHGNITALDTWILLRTEKKVFRLVFLNGIEVIYLVTMIFPVVWGWNTVV
jgi:hypothetical protein